MSGVRVRVLDLASHEDIETLAGLRAVTHGQQADDVFISELTGWLRTEGVHRRTWLAEIDGVAVGYVSALLYWRMPSVTRHASGWAYLGNLFVHHDHRGHGTGAELVTAVVDWARELGLSRVVLSPSELSVPMYERLGFRSADELVVLPLD